MPSCSGACSMSTSRSSTSNSELSDMASDMVASWSKGCHLLRCGTHARLVAPAALLLLLSALFLLGGRVSAMSRFCRAPWHGTLSTEPPHRFCPRSASAQCPAAHLGAGIHRGPPPAPGSRLAAQNDGDPQKRFCGFRDPERPRKSPGSTVASKNGGDPQKPPKMTGIHGGPIGDPGRPFHP